MSVETYREALATCLNGVDGLRATPYMTDQVNAPQAMIDFEVDYDLSFQRGADAFTFYVMVFDQRTSERAAQKRLDTWRNGGTDGLKYAIENDTALDSECDYTRVVRAGRPQVVTVGNVDYLMIEFQLEVVL